MIYNTPGMLSKIIDLKAQYTLQQPQLIIIQPDGTQAPTQVPLVSPAGATAATPHTFTSLFVPTQAGLHSANFQFITNTFNPGQTLNNPMYFWVSWTDVYTAIRSLLGVDDGTITDDQIGREFNNIFTELMDYSNNALPLYRAFNSTYQTYFDAAMVKLVASRIRPYVGGKRPSGEITLFKKGTTTVQYSVGAKPEFTIEYNWWLEGMAILDAKIPEIARILDMDRIGDEIATRGPLSIGNSHPTGNWLVGDYQSSTRDFDSTGGWGETD